MECELCESCPSTNKCVLCDSLMCDKCSEEFCKEHNTVYCGIDCVSDYCFHCDRPVCEECENSKYYKGGPYLCDDCYHPEDSDRRLHEWGSDACMMFGCSKCGGNYEDFITLCTEKDYDEAMEIEIRREWFYSHEVELFKDNDCEFYDGVYKMYKYMKSIIKSQQEYIEHLENRPPELGGPNYEAAKKHFTSFDY